MVTTYLDYTLISRDLNRSIDRVADQALVARETAYYKENIGSVTTVDEFLDDYRLYSYAMKAYGLEDMTYAVAFMRQVLESDLSDEESFANKLEDERYRTIARAFNFLGSATASQPDAVSDRQEDQIVGLYTQRMQDTGAVYKAEYDYYLNRIGSITSVDDLLADRRMTELALEAVGIDLRYYSLSTVRQALTSDPDDPASFVSQLGDRDYVELARLFNFGADGTVPSGGSAQSADQVRTLTEQYIFDAPGRVIPFAAELRTDYFTDRIGSIATVDELLGDSRMVAYIRAAYNIELTFSGLSDLRASLTSDLSDPDSFANTTTNPAYRALPMLFNFNTDGSLPAGVSAQSADQTASIVASYQFNYDSADETRDALRSNTFRAANDLIEDVDDLLGNSEMYNYALRAVGLDPATQSKDTIRRLLTSDLSDPNSFANLVVDERYKTLAGLFNFDTEGKANGARVAQSLPDLERLATDFIERKDLLELDTEEAAEAVAYYRDNILKVGSIDELLANEKLVSFIFDATGLDRETYDAEALGMILTSDLSDEKSFVNTLQDRSLRLLAASFNFAPDGSVTREAVGILQSRAALLETEENYLRQTLEIEAGVDNEGVRLALYFQRNAQNITNVFDILADPALQEVVRVALGLPAEVAQGNIDALAASIEDRLDIAEFSDPEKIEKFVQRFSALYDLENGAAASPVLTLFSGQGASGLGADMLASLAQVNSRRF